MHNRVVFSGKNEKGVIVLHWLGAVDLCSYTTWTI